MGCSQNGQQNKTPKEASLKGRKRNKNSKILDVGDRNIAENALHPSHEYRSDSSGSEDSRLKFVESKKLRLEEAETLWIEAVLGSDLNKVKVAGEEDSTVMETGISSASSESVLNEDLLIESSCFENDAPSFSKEDC